MHCEVEVAQYFKKHFTRLSIVEHLHLIQVWLCYHI